MHTELEQPYRGRAWVARKQRALDVARGPVQVFAAQLRETRAAAGDPTFAAMARVALRSKTSLSEAAGGEVFPTWETVEAFLVACRIPLAQIPSWRARWLLVNQQANDAAVRVQEDTRSAKSADETGPPAVVPGLELEPPAASEEPTADGRPSKRRWIIASAIAVTVAAAIGLGVVLLPRGAKHSTLPQTIAVKSPPPVGSWPPDAGCTRHSHWSYGFPSSYRGQVYVLIAADPRQSAVSTVRLDWGPWQWQQRAVAVEPGLVDRRVGGTALLFTKRYVDASNPRIQVYTTAPVCVTFGTTHDPSPAPLRIVNADQNWTDLRAG
jgi:hypothetical protein